MKILFLGDASNLHSTLATALRAMGHHVVLMSDGSRWMDTSRDIDLTRGSGLGGALRYAERIGFLKDGRFLTVATPAEILHSPIPEVQAFLAAQALER